MRPRATASAVPPPGPVPHLPGPARRHLALTGGRQFTGPPLGRRGHVDRGSPDTGRAHAELAYELVESLEVRA
ncbi:hypothetical protein AQ490_13085 [Wenjunlia vitaminophila]|uniref:Uncharacterized protein n=1 Tax=Wenjunlia vitaminophila TaxID=76728 RepID=A0A0T6LXY3_WENVI|nr:hypothetical protein AQ490_13085 [Wenjunlia vitaminophila]